MIILRGKSYSKDYYMSYDNPVGHFRRNQDKYLIGGGSLLGAGIGYLSSKNSAKKKAKDKGLQEGSEEYKKEVRKNRLSRTAIGAGIGGFTGLNASELKRMYDINHMSKKKTKLKAGDILKFTKKGPQLGQHYGVYDGKGGVIDYGSEGIKYTSLDEVMKNSKYVKIKAELTNKKHTKKDLERKVNAIKEKYTKNNYHFTDNNCEHFARELSNDDRFSTQGDDLTGKIARLVSKKKDPYGRN